MLTPAAALYEDEAGVNDWHKENLGRISALHAPANGDRLLVASEAAVIAALDAKDGSIAWRRVLDERDTIRAAIPVGDRALLTLTGTAGVARLWDSADGSLLRDEATSIRSAPAPLSGAPAGAAASPDGSHVYIASGDTVTSWQLEGKGSGSWKWSAEGDSAVHDALGNDAKVRVILRIVRQRLHSDGCRFKRFRLAGR